MIVIVMAQSKGGVGKTTLAVNVAGEITRYDRSVTLVDADPQGSASQWAEPRKLHFPVRREPLSLRNSMLWVRNVLKSGSDFVVVDLPAGFGPIFETAVMIADLLVVPSGPSSLDIGAAKTTILKARETRRNDPGGPSLKIVTVPTRVDLAHQEGVEIAEALLDLGEPVAPALSYDVDFVRSFTAGTTVSVEKPGSRASEDVQKLTLFLLKQVLPRDQKLVA
jgi:chromosome partitioning protein